MASAVAYPDRQLSDYRRALGQIRGGFARVAGTTSSLSLPSRTLDEWDRKMKESYEAGGAVKKLVERGREDYQAGNTSPLP